LARLGVRLEEQKPPRAITRMEPAAESANLTIREVEIPLEQLIAAVREIARTRDIGTLIEFTEQLTRNEGTYRLAQFLDMWSDVIVNARPIHEHGIKQGDCTLDSLIMERFEVLMKYATATQVELVRDICTGDYGENKPALVYSLELILKRDLRRREWIARAAMPPKTDSITVPIKAPLSRTLATTAVMLIFTTVLSFLLALPMIAYKMRNVPKLHPTHPTYPTRQYAGLPENKMEEVLGKPLNAGELEVFAKANPNYMNVREKLVKVMGARFMNLVERSANNLKVDPLMILTIFIAENGAVSSPDGGNAKFHFEPEGMLYAISPIRNGFEIEVRKPRLRWMPRTYTQNNPFGCAGPFQFKMSSFKTQQPRVQKALGVDIAEGIKVVDPRTGLVRSIAACASYLRDAGDNPIPKRNKKPKSKFRAIRTGEVASLANYYSSGDGRYGYGTRDIKKTGGVNSGVADQIYAQLATPSSRFYRQFEK
ncbi:hypothetical protein HY570_01080, partial [Candidatus Micrarchaeota archaeon]|nr:hypothetical protein [Candidatus Micrarchaeota archaeon]